MRKVSVIIFLWALAMECPAALPGDDFNANTATAISALQQWYNASGLWNTTGWWNAANCVDALENGIAANNGQNYLNILTNTYNLNSAANFLDGYYDDEGWWAETWIRAYDLTGNVLYLNMAKTLFSDMTGGWDATCGGGIWWNKTRTYKNAIANELFLLAAIRLHQRTPGDGGTGSYFYWATNECHWFTNSGLINAQNLINDGLSNCVNNGETTWTYNQGVILGGLADLYKTTGDAVYLSWAETLANAATSTLMSGGTLQEPCEPTGCGGGNTPQFKGIFIRHLACLYDIDHNPAYFNFLYTNAHTVWFHDHNNSNQFGLKWTGSFDSADAARQSSAIMPLSALAAPATALLFFAKGSGDPAFSHAVGQSAGALAWSAGPGAATAPGFMQDGPYIVSLPTGTHVVHFRLAVNALSNAAVTLAQLSIVSQASTIVNYSVPWNAFAQANQPQDFALAFTNSAAGNQLDFQVYWYAAANAPLLTVSDVTLDGAHNWTAANLAHTLGRLDGLEAWEADPIRDTASGYLTAGPGTLELFSGAYAAKFELKVDNFNADNAAVVTLSVVNTDSNTVVASRTVARTEFPDVLYHPFALNFQAMAGVHYDFRAYWNYATNAPRLTQRSLVVAPAGSPGFAPVALTASSYNADMIVEHTASPSPQGAATTASMDVGATNTGTSWYEQGYDSSAPATGLPAAGSAITGQSASDHGYTFAPSYTAANAAMIDSTHSAVLTPAAANAFSALSFLGAAGHGPVTVDYTVIHADGTTEPGLIKWPDWFGNTPVAFGAQGRVNVAGGSFSSVNTSNPNLYAEDITLTNTFSPVARINLNWDSGNTGGLAAVFALGGLAQPPLTLQAAVSGGVLILTWPSGALLQAANPAGPWTTNIAATSPWPVTQGGTMFYKVQSH